MDDGHFEDFRRPKFLYTGLFDRLLSYIFQKSHQTLRPRSCRVNQNFDISWILDLGLKGNDKRKRCAAMKLNISLNDLAVKLRIHDRQPMLSYLSSLPIAVLRSLDTEANRFYDRNHQMFDAALLTRCYTLYAPRPFIDSESNHINLDAL